MLKRIAAIGFFIIHFSNTASLAQELKHIPVAIQISSAISDGKYTIPEIAGLASENGFKAVVITERDTMKWEYGLWPLRTILKKTVEDKSLATYGLKRYFQDIAAAGKAYPDITVIPGVEAAPFYYWTGSVFSQDLSIHDWHKHIIVFGLAEEDLELLPVVGNKKGLFKPFKAHNALFLGAVVLAMIAGIYLVSKKQFDYRDSFGRRLGPSGLRCRISGILLLAIAVLISLDRYPFRDVLFDQYQAKDTRTPYQNFIDYVKEKGGVSFWSHPEAKNSERSGFIKIETAAHSEDLIRTEGYTGFSIFYEGYNTIGSPGGIWDQLLKEYCSGKRKDPLWAIGGLAFDSQGDLNAAMKDLRNICLAASNTGWDIISAFKQGRSYVVKGVYSSRFLLDCFSVQDSALMSEQTMGGAITVKGNPRIKIKGSFFDAGAHPCAVRLIKNGKIIESFEAEAPFDIMYEDKSELLDQKSYYRVEIEAQGLLAVTNPVFVVKEEIPKKTM